MVATDVLEVDVDTVGGETGQRILGRLLLVVEAGVEAELLDDEVKLLVGADGANDTEALALGDLADDLTDGAGGGADEDGLALLGLADLVEAGPARQAGHAEGAEEVAEVEVVGVDDLADHAGLGVRDDVVLGDGAVADDEITLLEIVVAALQDLAEGTVDDGVVCVESRGVGLGVGVAHLAAEVGVVRGILSLEEETTRGEVGIEVNGTVLGDDVLAVHREPGRDLLVDEGLVLSLRHGEGGCKWCAVG